jgi:hypothetical protein
MKYQGGIVSMRMLLLSKNDKLGIDKSKETLKESIKKLEEEYFEAEAEAVVIEWHGFDRNHELAQELLDVIQVASGMLKRQVEDGCIDIETEFAEHNMKLLNNGWEYDGEVAMDINWTGNYSIVKSYVDIDNEACIGVAD